MLKLHLKQAEKSRASASGESPNKVCSEGRALACDISRQQMTPKVRPLGVEEEEVAGIEFLPD